MPLLLQLRVGWAVRVRRAGGSAVGARRGGGRRGVAGVWMRRQRQRTVMVGVVMVLVLVLIITMAKRGRRGRGVGATIMQGGWRRSGERNEGTIVVY